MQSNAAAVSTRNRAIIGIRAWTIAAILGSAGVSWLFAFLSEQYFSGKPPEVVVPPVPNLAAPVQKAPIVIKKVVHKVGYPPGTAPRPPSTAPGAAPAPAPPPACHSTPSKPC